MAVCKIEIARVWSMLLKPVQPVHPISAFKNYINYYKQNNQPKQPVPDFKTVLAVAVKEAK